MFFHFLGPDNLKNGDNSKSPKNELLGFAMQQEYWGRNTDIEFDKASLYEYTREWVDRVKRGGFIEVTDDYLLILLNLSIEKF